MESSMDKKQRQCFLFYVYGWFFGLGLGVIAAIYCFVEHDTVLSRANMGGAVCLSLAVAIAQISLNTCAKERFDKIYRLKISTIIRMVGLSLIMVATLAGTFSSDQPGGLFFICAIFSFACYLMAFIGFSVRVCRENKSTQQGIVISQQGDPTGHSLHHLDYVYPPWETGVRVMYHSDRDFVEIGSGDHFDPNPEVRYSNHEPSLPVLTLPTYSEAVADPSDSRPPKPPEYRDSDSHGTDIDTDVPAYSVTPEEGQGCLTSESYAGVVVPESDSPPQYQEVVQERFWAL